MAPAPTGRPAVLAWLRSAEAGRASAWLPLGGPTVQAGVVREQGVWRVREAQLDHDALDAFVAQLRAAGKPLYPEHVDRFRRPTGPIKLEAATLDEFIARIEAYDWPPNW